MKKTDVSAKRIFEFCVSHTREEMGRAAARDVAQAMTRFIRETGKVNIVLAAAPSQNEFLAHLGRSKGIDWSRVTAFHLDDYVDLPRHHPNTFEEYLEEHIFNRVEPGKKHLFKALKGSPAEIAKKYAALIQSSGGIDISCLGIGENGHLAFCEPGSDFRDPRMVRIVRIDERTVRQQYRDYHDNPNPEARYASLAAVPRRAFTITIPTILSSREIFTIVPGPKKAAAVRRMWEGRISPASPASALRLHSNVKIYLDEDSVGKLSWQEGPETGESMSKT